MPYEASILVVDDDEATLVATSLVLRNAGYHVHEARTGAECLDLTRRLRPDLVLLDVFLPDIDGFRVADAIRSDSALVGTLVAHCTAKRKSEESRIEGLELGAHDYIIRPIGNRELVARVSALLRVAEAERAKWKSEACFRAIFKRAGIGIATVSTDGTILLANDSFRRMLGYDEMDMAGLSVADVSHPEDYLQEVSLLRDLMQGRCDTYQLDKRYVHRDGHYVWGHLTTSLVRDLSGAVEYAIGMVEDITRLVEAEAARAESESRYRQAEEKSWRHLAQLAAGSRLTLLGQTAANLAHELNQPLCSIASAVQAGRRGVEAPNVNLSLVSRSLGLIERQTQLASEIVARIRDRGLNALRKRAPAELNAVIRDSLAMLAHELEREGIKASAELAENLPMSSMDTVEIEQVLLNLLRNAIEAMVESSDDRRLLTVTSRLIDPGHLQVSIADTGCGFSDEAKDNLFSPFFTTKEGGMGMGLAISRSIVEAHHGHIALSRNAGGGSTFQIVLPIAPDT